MTKRAGFFLLLPLLVCADCTSPEVLTCPGFTCDTAGDLLPDDICALCNLKENSCTIRPCVNSTLSCPEPKVWFSGEVIPCGEWDESRWTATTFSDYYGVSPLTSGQVCIPDDPYHACSFDDDLVCFCESDLCTCVNGVGYGGSCTSDLACFQGYVCNSGQCLKQNSLEAGMQVTNPLACVSGEVERLGDAQRCTNPTRTLGIIPKVCSTCLDCQSLDGTSYGDCVCGLSGKSYCSLFRGDDPWLEYLDLAPNHRYSGIVYWEFVIRNYPYLADAPDCMDEVVRGYAYYEKGAPNYSKAGLLGLCLLGLLA